MEVPGPQSSNSLALKFGNLINNSGPSSGSMGFVFLVAL
jgi:hypothetical protein